MDYGKERAAKEPAAYNAILFSQPAMCRKISQGDPGSQEIEFPKTHDLLILNTLCAERGIFTGFTKEDLGRLSGYSVHTRYPGNQPTSEEAKDALRIAETIRRFTRIFLRLKK